MLQILHCSCDKYLSESEAASTSIASSSSEFCHESPFCSSGSIKLSWQIWGVVF
ncbi:uncharacterized protein DS421_17g580120 [Arachis hypogaea]|nr:uncharacterized protein DS421_17g580120 [Arachis hypogaea]